MNVTITGDTQLWIIPVDDWFVPLFAVPIETDGGVRAWDAKPAVLLPVSQYGSLSLTLGRVSLMEGSAGWIVSDSVFRSLAAKAPGITPAYYYRRSDEPVTHATADVDPATAIFDPLRELREKPADTFAEHVWRRTAMAELGTIRMMWNAFAQEAAYWLLVEGKPIDLGWFKISALPVRDNWKQILLAKFPHLASLNRGSKADAEQWLAASGFWDEFYSTGLIKLGRSGANRVVGWTPEIETTDEWDAYVNDLESDRSAMTTPKNYVAWWGLTMKALRSNALAILLRFASQTCRPAGSVGSARSGSDEGFVEHLDGRKIKPVRVDDCDVAAVSSDGYLAVRTPDGRAVVPLQDAPVREVPVFQLSPAVVRNPGRNAGFKRSDDARRVPVLDAGRGKGAG